MANSKMEGGNALMQSTTSHGNEERESNPDLKGLMLLIAVLRDIKDSLNDKRN